MPCYDPPPTPEDLARWLEDAKRRGDWAYVYRQIPRESLEQWLCDALRVMDNNGLLCTVDADCLSWWELHKQIDDHSDPLWPLKGAHNG